MSRNKHEVSSSLRIQKVAGALAHEVLHPALHHHVRRSGRDPKRWNVACDYAINPLLVDAGLSLPDGVLLDNPFRGMSAEQIYNLLETESEPELEPGGEDQTAGIGGNQGVGARSPSDGGNEPGIKSLFHPIRDGNRSNVSAFAHVIDDRTPLFPTLQALQRQFRKLAAAQAATERDGQDRSITLSGKSLSIGYCQSAAASPAVSQLPKREPS